jgi:hypothetical protein
MVGFASLSEVETFIFCKVSEGKTMETLKRFKVFCDFL